ncbi:hypothetical protein Tco_0692369 [Tanacetum coccineum]
MVVVISRLMILVVSTYDAEMSQLDASRMMYSQIIEHLFFDMQAAQTDVRILMLAKQMAGKGGKGLLAGKTLAGGGNKDKVMPTFEEAVVGMSLDAIATFTYMKDNQTFILADVLWIPIIGGSSLDLHHLFIEVTFRCGFKKVYFFCKKSPTLEADSSCKLSHGSVSGSIKNLLSGYLVTVDLGNEKLSGFIYHLPSDALAPSHGTENILKPLYHGQEDVIRKRIHVLWETLTQEEQRGSDQLDLVFHDANLSDVANGWNPIQGIASGGPQSILYTYASMVYGD